jgi:inward rectifier potassium channel
MTEPENDPPRLRFIARNEAERTQVVSIGKERQWLDDSYVRLLSSSWKRVFGVIALIYLNANMLFALLYLVIGNGIQNARPGSFADAFFFSVQTLSTIGYGQMYPIGTAANLVVTLEALSGFAFYGMITGLIFSKFSRPSARVLFSKVAVICTYQGVPHLMIRLANQRRNRIVEANVNLVILRDDKEAEGVLLRRFVDLVPLRAKVPLLQLTWTLMHRIDETSPLYGMTTETGSPLP